LRSASRAQSLGDTESLAHLAEPVFSPSAV